MSDNSYDYQKPNELINVLKKFIGLGLILVEGDVHKFQRKRKFICSAARNLPRSSRLIFTDLLPSFRINHIKQLYPVFWRKGCELVSTLRVEGPEKSPPTEKGFEVDIGKYTTRATLDIIGCVTT